MINKAKKNRVISSPSKPWGGKVDTDTTRDKLLRIGKITRVDWENFVCDIEWEDGPGKYPEVPITMPFSGARAGMEMIPAVGSTVVCSFYKASHKHNRPLILSYLPPGKAGINSDPVQSLPQEEVNAETSGNPLFPKAGDPVRARKRKLYPGEMALSSHHGAEVSLTRGVLLSDAKLDEIHINPFDQSIVQNSINSYQFTEAVYSYSGAAKRTIERAYLDDGSPGNLIVAPKSVRDNPDLLIMTEEGKERFYLTVGGNSTINDGLLNGTPNTAPLTENRKEVYEIGKSVVTHTEETVDLHHHILDLIERGADPSDPCSLLPPLANERRTDEFGSDVIRKGPIIESGEGTLIGNTFCDEDKYGVALKPQIYKTWSEDGQSELFIGKHQSFPEVNEVPVRLGQDPDATDVRYFSAAWWWKMPYEYSQTRMYISKEGVVHLYVGNSYELEDCPFTPQLENPLGSGRSMEAYYSGSVKTTVDKNRKEEESIISSTIGQVRFHFGRDDGTPSLVRRQDSKIQNYLNYDKLDPYGDSEDPLNPKARGATNTGTEDDDRLRSRTGVVRPLLTPGDNPDFTGDHKTGAEFKSIVGTTDGGITLRVGRDQGNVKRKFHYNATPFPEGDTIADPLDPATIDVRNEDRRVYDNLSGDELYRFKADPSRGGVRSEHILPEVNRASRVADVLGSQKSSAEQPSGFVYSLDSLQTPDGHAYILKPENQDYSGHSLDAHFVSNIWLRVGRDHDPEGNPRDNLSAVIDTAGGVVYRLGADSHDLHSITGQTDGAVFLTIGKSKQAGKSFNATLEGGYKAFIGADHSTGSGVSVIRNYTTHPGNDGAGIHSNECVADGAGDAYYMWTPNNSSARVAHFMPAAAKATRMQDLHPTELTNPDVEGRSIEVLTAQNAWIRLGEDELDNKSLTLDFAGGIISRVGRENKDHHSVTSTYDGAIFTVIGKSQAAGKSVSANLEGGLKLMVGQNLSVKRNWVTKDKLSNTPQADGQGDVFYRFNPSRDQTRIEHIMDQTGRAVRELGNPSPAHLQILNNQDIEGQGIEIHSQGNMWFRCDDDDLDGKSVVVDTAGGMIFRIGREKNDYHSITATYDGAIYSVIGSSLRQKKSISSNLEGGMKIRVGKDNEVNPRAWVTRQKHSNDCLTDGLEQSSGDGPYTFKEGYVLIDHFWPQIGRATREVTNGTADPNRQDLPQTLTNSSTEATSLEAHLEGSVALRIDRDKNDHRSVTIDTSGGLFFRIGQELHDGHSVTATYDGGIYSVIGQSLNHQRSISTNMTGGMKLRIGKSDSAPQRAWVTGDKLSNDCTHAGVGDDKYRSGGFSATSTHVMSETARSAFRDTSAYSRSLNNEDTEALGAEIHIESNVVLRVQADDEDKKSWTEDFEGGIIRRIGRMSADNQSVLATYDGGIFQTVGKSKLDGRSFSANAEGGLKVRLGASNAVNRGYFTSGLFASTSSGAGLGDAVYQHHNMNGLNSGGSVPFTTSGNSVGDVGLEGKSLEMMLDSDAWVRIGKGDGGRSLTLDLDGGTTFALGKDDSGSRSITTQLDGGIELSVIGPDAGGDAFKSFLTGNKKMRISGQEQTGIEFFRQAVISGDNLSSITGNNWSVTAGDSYVDSRGKTIMSSDTLVQAASGAAVGSTAPVIMQEGAVFFGSVGPTYTGVAPQVLTEGQGTDLPVEPLPTVSPSSPPRNFITEPMFFTNTAGNIHTGTLFVFGGAQFMGNTVFLGQVSIVGNLTVSGSITSMTPGGCCGN